MHVVNYAMNPIGLVILLQNFWRCRTKELLSFLASKIKLHVSQIQFPTCISDIYAVTILKSFYLISEDMKWLDSCPWKDGLGKIENVFTPASFLPLLIIITYCNTTHARPSLSAQIKKNARVVATKSALSTLLCVSAYVCCLLREEKLFGWKWR